MCCKTFKLISDLIVCLSLSSLKKKPEDLALFFMYGFQINVVFLNNKIIDGEAVNNGIKVYMTFACVDHILEHKY